MKFLKPIILLLLVFLCTGICPAQTKKIETLSAQLQRAKSKEERLTVLLTLFEEYQSLNRDTLYNLALEARELSALQPDKNKKGLAAIALSDAYMRWGWTDSALAALEPALADEKGYYKSIYYKMQRRRAMVYASHSDMEKALAILFPALSGSEIEKDTLNTAAIMNSIGSIKMANGNTNEALVWIQKAVLLCSGNAKYKTVLAAAYTNAANAYFQKNSIDSSLYYIEEAISLCRETENLFVLATALRIKSSLLVTKKRFSEAEAAIKEMIATRKLTSGSNFYVEDNLQLSDFYANTGQLEKAIQFCRQFLQTGNVYDTSQLKPAILTNDPKIRLEYWQALARYYKQGNRLPEYQESLEEIVLLKDSFYSANSALAIADAETKYEVQKKENTILQQKYSLQRNRFLLFGSIGLLAMALIITYFIFRDYRRKQKLKMEVAMAEEHAKAEVAVKEAEEKERVRIAADLHDNIGTYASAIRADVEKITQGTLDNSNHNLENLRQHSQEIMNSLRDTIWVLNKENITIAGISDRIKNYISKLQPSYEQVQFNIEETVTNDVRINSQTALNIFRIVQEAIHNSLKHSLASCINISVNSGETISMVIKDNGKGMDMVQHGSGNGFVNMQARAKESGLKLSMHSAINEGTSVAIDFPTTN